MIKVEGYKAFRGTMRITPANINLQSITIHGDWLYKPEYDCWYCKGSSYPASICHVEIDETKEMQNA